MISLGRRWDGVERGCERREGCRVRWASGLGVDQGLPAGRWSLVSPLPALKTALAGASIRPDHARRVRSGGEIELGLRVGSCRRDRWRPRRQADAFQVGPDRGRLGQRGGDLHDRHRRGIRCRSRTRAPGAGTRTGGEDTVVGRLRRSPRARRRRPARCGHGLARWTPRCRGTESG